MIFKKKSVGVNVLNLILYTGLFVFSACQKDVKRLEDLSPKQTKIEFENKVVSSPELNILNYLYFYNGAGVASGDFNNDGLQDLYFVSNMGEDKLYLNQGDLSFKDVTSQSGIINNKSWSSGVSVVDINQDGMLDIYISR